jgi:vitamin B12 transporter
MLKYLPIAAALVAPPVLAQSTSEDDVIVSATRVAQDAREVGQAVTVIDRAEIETRQTTVLSDLLATTPGVTATRNGGVGGFTGVRIRGAEAEQTLVVIDGVRVNDPSSPGGGFDFANLLSGSVDRVEILRGPNSVPWGSQALGGVVNIVTLQPTEEVRIRANAEYGYADSVFATAGIAGSKGAVSGALNAGYLRTDGISSAASGTERDGYRQYGASGKLGVEFAPGVSLDLRGYWADSRVEIDGFPPPTFAFADTGEYSTTQELYGYAGLNAEFGALKNRIAFTIADIDRDNFDPAFGDAPSFIGRGRSERYEYQGEFRPVDAVRVVAGVERENSRFADGFDRFSTGITSVYGQLIVKPLEPLTLTGGVRHDDHDQYGGETTFGANAALALGTGTTLRASYGEGFKAPTLFQLYSDFGFRDLQPERARNFDAGVEQAFLDDRARVSVTYFNRRTRNQIDFDLGTFTYRNIARTAADGVEFALALKPVDSVTFSANYTYTDANNRSTGANFGNLLPRRARDSVTANIDWRTPWGPALGATVTHVGGTFDNLANTVRLDGYVLASLRAELPVGEHMSLYGRVENLFDEQYQTVAGYGTIGRAAYGGVRVKL